MHCCDKTEVHVNVITLRLLMRASHHVRAVMQVRKIGSGMAS